MAGKSDIKRDRKDLYAPRAGRFHLVDVPELPFLMVDGTGDPNTSGAYADAVTTLFSVSYALKFASKRELDRDYVVAPLEGLWSADDPATFVTRAKDDWAWTMMITQPEWITPAMVEARADLQRPAPRDLSGRSAADRAGEAAHHPPPARHPAMRADRSPRAAGTSGRSASRCAPACRSRRG